METAPVIMPTPIQLFFSYSRVSPTERMRGLDSIERQKQQQQKWADDHGARLIFFEDVLVSGKRGNRRPGLESMLEAIPEHRPAGILVTKVNRLGRSMLDLAQISDRLRKENVAIVSFKEGLDTRADSMNTRIYFAMLALVSEIEREWINERMGEARKARYEEFKKEGKQWGRPALRVRAAEGNYRDISPDLLLEMSKRVPRPTYRDMAKELGCSTKPISTFFKKLKKSENNG